MRRQRYALAALALAATVAACNPRPLLPFLPKTSAERLRSNPIVLARSCTSCHTIGASGGTVGPILNQIANRRSRDWLRTWLHDPQAVKPGTKMPNFGFTDQELEVLLADLTDMRRDFDPQAILAEAGTPAEKGRKLFEAYDCYACHRVGRNGRYNGPDLTWVGKWQDMNWEKGWLKDPVAHRSGTFMPNFGLSPETIDALAAFLGTLKGQSYADDQRWTDRAYREKPVKRGELVFEKLGCRGCHGEAGRAGGFRNPNAAPDEMVPPLTKASEQYSEAELKNLVLSNHRPKKLDPNGPEPPLVCPAWSGAIADAELDDLVTYVVSLGPKKSKWEFK